MNKKILSLTLTIGVLITLAFSIPNQSSAQTIEGITIPKIEKPFSEMTITELKAKITELTKVLQQVQTFLLQLKVGTPNISAIPSDYTFNTNLKYGQSSIGIKYLQLFLNSDLTTQVSTSGAGSPNNETNYFGQRTLQAVIKFQEKYKDDILSVYNLIKGTGYVGRTTRAKINELLQQYKAGIGEEEEEVQRGNTDGLCPSGCTYSQDPDCTYCGDNIIQSPNSEGIDEVCDNTNLLDQTCQTRGYTGGTLSCSLDCLTFDTSECLVSWGGRGGEQEEEEEPINNPPILNTIGSKSTNENQTLSFTISATDPDNDILTYSIMGLVSGVTFKDQTFTWKPSYTQSGKYNFTFIVSDSELTDSEDITVTVNNINRAPILSSIDNKSVTQNNTLTFTVSATDPDNDPLTYSAQNLPTGAAFSTTTKTFSWAPPTSKKGTYNITFIVADSKLQDSETITITVTSAPVCGDGTCNGTETCSSCPKDCGACPIGKVYYLDAVNGDDANPGTSELPWKTMARAYYDHDNDGVTGYVQRGDTVLIYDGNYAGFEQDGYKVWDNYVGDLNELFDPNYAGWITYKAAPDNENVNFDFIELLSHAVIQEIYYKFEDIHIPDGAPAHDSLRRYNIYVSGRGLWFKNVTSHGYESSLLMYDPNYGSFNMWYNTWIQGCSGVMIEDCNLTYGSGVLYANGNQITVRDCNIAYSEADHIRLSGSRITIEDCDIHSWVYGTRPQLDGIDDADRAHGDLLQTVGDSYYVTVRRNVFRDHFSQGVWYSYGTGYDFNDHLWENNLFYNLGNYDVTFAHCNDLVFRNNTLVGSGFYSSLRQNQDPITNFSAYNNIIITNWTDIYEYPFTRMGYHNYNIGFYQNNYNETYQPIYYEPNSLYTSATLANRWSAFIDTAHSLFAGTLDYTFGEVQDHDPVLIWTNAVPSDFKLKAGSAAINFGTTSQGYPISDILGNPRDLFPDAGCYEYQGGAQQCAGTDISCGIWPNCQNCNNSDGCSGTVHRDYYCSGTSCVYTDYPNDSRCFMCTPGQTQSCTTGLLGMCSSGTQTCQINGTLGSCVQNNQPTVESCNDSLDNDCDGQTDCSDTDCSADPVCQTVIPTDYISFWKFEGNANDEKGANNGIIQGNPQFVSGVQGQVLSFDGTGDYISVADNDSLNFGTSTDFTISVWFKDLKSSWGGNIVYKETSPAWYSVYTVSPTQGWARIAEGAHDIYIQFTPVANGWNHVVAVFDRDASLTTYINGKKDSSGSITSIGNINNTANLWIGNSHRGFWNGTIDNVMLFNRALTQAEIQQIYNVQKPSSPTAMTKLNEIQLNNLASIFSAIQSAIEDIFKKIQSLF